MQLLGNLTSPSEAAVRAEMTAAVEQALECMNPIDREVLALRHFEELTNTETAEVLGIEQKAASIRYVRALARLKAILPDVPGADGAQVRQ
jgi:RNA polymerase sigma-70 factor (ECF subfamily)